MKLPTRLFSLIILTMLPLVAIAVYNEIDVRSQRAQEGSDQALRLVRLVAQEQARTAEGARQLLTALSKMPMMRDGDAPACSAFLEDLTSADKRYINLMSIDLTGRSICVGGRGKSGAYFDGRPYFRLAIATGSFAFGEYDVDSSLEQRLIYLAQPYYDREGKIAGAVAAGLSLDWLNDEIAHTSLPPHATVSVVDRKGTILARFPEKDRFVGTKIPGQSHSYMLTGEEGVREAPGFDGITRIYAYTPLPGAPSGLTLSVGLEKREILKGFEAASRRDIMVLAGSSLLALSLAGLGARLFITRPIKALMDAADHWRQGDLDVRVPSADSGSEFGRLGAAFNAMAAAAGNREQDRERQVREQTEALRQAMEARQSAEAALREARKMETVGRLTGGVAHDFNNILAAIVGNIELACARLGPASAKLPWLDAAMQSANRGAALIQRLLTFTRRQALRPQAVDLNRHISVSLDMVQRLLRSDVRVEAMLAPDAWLVMVDPNQLEAAILNLAINARDAMPDGGALRLETTNVSLTKDTSVELEGDFVALTVTDNGTGIPPSVLENVFEPFFTTKEMGAGSGLGLSMVQGFARQSSGAVSIRSEVGRGTTVTLYLPRTAERPKTDQVAVEATVTGVGTILLVDDDPEVRSVTSQLLAMSGYFVVAAANASEALAALERAGAAKIDVLITDLVLEGGPNGIVLASEVRTKRPDLPVLLMTGHSDALLSGSHLNGIELLIKPFGHTVLQQAIGRAIGAARPGSVGVAPGATST